MYEAICTKCGETFNPNYFDDHGRLDCEHGETELGVTCGGAGRLLGAYGGTDPDVPTVNDAGLRDAEVFVVVTVHAGQVKDLEVLDRPPRWAAEPGQTCYVGSVNGGDSIVHQDADRGWGSVAQQSVQSFPYPRRMSQ